jgi:co-chaperonin GroES (HSP10)
MTVIIPKADWLTFTQNITKNDSGIVLPDSAKDLDLCKNIVEHVGDKVTRVKPGDEIIILQKTASKMHFPERDIKKDLFIVKEENVIAVIEEF